MQVEIPFDRESGDIIVGLRNCTGIAMWVPSDLTANFPSGVATTAVTERA